MFAINDNFVRYQDKDIIMYTTDTLAGSSGAPVLNQASEAVAIHTSSMNLKKPIPHFNQEIYVLNVGLRINRIVDYLKTHNQSLWDTINS